MLLREYLWTMLQVKGLDIFGSKKWSLLFIRSSEHGGYETPRAGSCNHVKVVCKPCFFTIQFLELRFEEFENGSGNDALDTTPIDAENGD